MTATVVCALGMHRSGTSLVARMLNLLGVHLGPDARVLTMGDDNPTGYWEHRPLVDLNDEILARFGGSWDDEPAFPPSWPRDPRLLDLRAKARQLLDEDFAGKVLWGWKDPRTSLTLPFWQDVIGPMRYVICVRNPSAVVASLHRRSGMPAEHAERLWLGHVQASLAHTSGGARLFVFFEDILEDWRHQLRRLAAFVGRPEHADDPHVQEAVAGFVKTELCHHRVTTEDLAADPQITFPTLGLYLALRGSAAPNVLDRVGARALAAWQETAARSAEREGFLQANGALAAERDTLTEAARAQAAAISSLSVERDELLVRAREATLRQQHLERQLAEEEQREQRSRESIAALESELRTMTELRDAQVRTSEEAFSALQEIHTSPAWRLVTLGRARVGRLLPEGTGRRRAYDNLLRRLARRLPAPPAQRTSPDLRTV